MTATVPVTTQDRGVLPSSAGAMAYAHLQGLLSALGEDVTTAKRVTVSTPRGSGIVLAVEVVTGSSRGPTGKLARDVEEHVYRLR